MAKQLSIIQFKNKLGELVGNKKSAGQKYNTIRQRILSIKNPATVGQCTQRMKLLPAQNFYRALAGILDHAFQGRATGAPCQSKFMQQALLMAEGFPYLTKGDTTPVPGEYMISQGSLNPVNDIMFGETAGGPEAPFIGADWLPNMTLEAYNTRGETSQFILRHNPLVQDGDQMTFVMCIAPDPVTTSSSFIYRYFRFIIDSSSDEPMDGWAEAQGVGIDADFSNMFYIPSLHGYTCVAAACIVSRRPRHAGGAWMRSTTYMKVDNEIKNLFMSQRALEGSLASYEKKEGSSSSSLYLNQAGEGDTVITSMRTVNVNITPQGGGTVEGAGSYEYGSAVALRATASQGYVFAGWYRDEALVTLENPYNFVIASDITLNAQFSLNDNP